MVVSVQSCGQRTVVNAANATRIIASETINMFQRAGLYSVVAIKAANFDMCFKTFTFSL